MKMLLTLISLAVTSLSTHAGQIMPPAMLIKHWAVTMNREIKTPELSSIEYAKVMKQNPIWTKEAVNKLFASIDSEKIKFVDHDSLDNVIMMEEPFKIKFTFEVSHRDSSAPNRVTTFYSLVGIERIENESIHK